MDKMKIKIKYPTTEKKYLSTYAFQYVSKDAELKPVKFLRRRCGSGKAATRYYYSAVFISPDDAAFVYDGFITENINRKNNPKFAPKKLNWIGNIAIYGCE